MQQNKRTLIVGATPNETRYANIATHMLLDFGHEVVLFGIKKGEVREIPILNEWPINADIDTITMYINPRLQEQYYEQILALQPKRIIFNPGTENVELVALAKKGKIETLDACTLVLLRTGQY